MSPLSALAATFTFASVAACAPSNGAPPVPASHAAGASRILRVMGEAGALRVSDGGPSESATSPVVFVHGLGTDLDVWTAQLAFVRSGGRRAIAYDQRGHGQSDRPKDGVYSLDALARDLESVRQSLGLARMVIVGHSISGDVVTAYAAAHPERVAGIVYADAVGDFGFLPREQREKAVAREGSLTRDGWTAEWKEILGSNAKPETRRQVLASLDKVETSALAALSADNIFFPARGRAAHYSGPRWAIETDEPGAEFRASRLDPTIHLVTLRGVSHWLMLDDPAAFDAALGEALAKMP